MRNEGQRARHPPRSSTSATSCAGSGDAAARARSDLTAIGLGGGISVRAGDPDHALVWGSVSAAAASPRFAVCGALRHTCVVDGDTFWLEGDKIRIADIDTPEISEPRCASEYERGIRARDRLVVLLNQGPIELAPIGDRDEDRYGRKLRVVTRGGASLGDQLVGEGLARTWTGRREPWC